MLLPLAQLIEGRGRPLCIPQTARVEEALRLMLKNGISQLPVIEDDGDLVGIVSHKTITHALFLLGDRVPLLQLTVDHCMERVDTLTVEDDVFEACDKLSTGTGSLVITENRKPVGVVTTGDLMSFFRDRSEDFIKLEDIEVTLRLRTRDAFPDDSSMERALLVALGPRADNPAKPRRDFDELSMGELVTLMTHEENWPKFNGMFEPIELFQMLMNRVRQVRNLLAHFRGRSDLMQERVLKYAMDWLSMRARPSQSAGGPRRVEISAADVPTVVGGKRWERLSAWLREQEKAPDGIRVGFSGLQTLLGGPLPAAALKHPSWWSNKNTGEAQVAAWLGAGWQVASVDVGRKEVIFQPQPAAQVASPSETDFQSAAATP